MLPILSLVMVVAVKVFKKITPNGKVNCSLNQLKKQRQNQFWHIVLAETSQCIIP